jgi:hypothetical protein
VKLGFLPSCLARRELSSFPIDLSGSASTLKVQPDQEFIMGKGNNSRKKEVKKPKKEKPKVLATRKTV